MALIPKVDNGVEIKKLRPISMVSCLYKVIDKIFANTLRMVMFIVIKLDSVVDSVKAPGHWFN